MNEREGYGRTDSMGTDRAIQKNPEEISAQASPSLALLKYWGKKHERKNLPATTSIALTLSSELYTRARVCRASRDAIYVDGQAQALHRYAPILAVLRKYLRRSWCFEIFFTGTVPFAAGLAGSSSAFAALAAAVSAMGKKIPNLRQLSSFAGLGSASAARAVFGGFTILRAGARYAAQLFAPSHWEDLRIIVVLTSRERKPISSREAMHRVAQQSPYYRAWLRSSAAMEKDMYRALRECDLEKLGVLARRNYLHMFATMLSVDILYWNTSSLQLIHAVASMRKEGLPVWETMDAGPQLKLLTLAAHVEQITERLQSYPCVHSAIVVKVGEGVRVLP